MANQIPLSGAADASGGFILPDAQGAILTNGLLVDSGALAIAGDSRATSSRKETFPVWLGNPTASFVGEGALKPITGAELSSTALNIKKVATIIPFTDEMREDVANGDLDTLVDTGVRSSIADVIDAHIVGKDSGTDLATSFDSMLRSTTSTVELGTAGDALRLAISAAMGTLEANGYRQNLGVLLASDVARAVRDARAAVETTTAIYDAADPFYGLEAQFSTNLNTLSEVAGAGKIVAFVVSRPNLHVRIRKDVEVSVSNSANYTTDGGTTWVSAFQQNETLLRYETRLGFMVHDMNRSVVAITNAA